MKNIYLILILVVILFSCEKTINIKIPDQDRKLTVNSLFSKDSNMIVYLTESRYILDDEFEFDPVENANVNIFKNGSLLENLTEITPGNYKSNFILDEKANYQIEISSNKFHDVKAESYLPEKTDIISISTTKSIDEYGSDVIKFKLKFKDHPNTENFYFVQVFKNVMFYDWETDEETGDEFLEAQYLYSDDPNTFEEWGIGLGLLVSDEFINGREYNLSFTSYSNTYYYGDEPNNENLTTYYIQFHTISKDYYQYYKTLAKHKEAQDEFFMEPLQVYNNIENGFGIFAGLATAVDSVKIE